MVRQGRKMDFDILTESMDVATEEYNEFRTILLNEGKKRSEEDKKTVELLALKFKMEDYNKTE